jgi:hypothetical protein
MSTTSSRVLRVLADLKVRVTGHLLADLKVRPTYVVAIALAILCGDVASSQSPRFFSDDPIAREPDPEDASGAQPDDIGLVYDLGYNLFVTAGRVAPNTRARNINTIDEVPDSSWFTNRIGAHAMTVDEITRGPLVGPPPAAEKWTIIREKSSGYAPGFTARGARGETWFISFDPPSNPKGATAAIVIANKLFWALGYHQVETFLTHIDPRRVEIDPKATVRRPNGKRTPFTQNDLEEVLERAARNADGTYEAAASRLLQGKILGPFRYSGTRPDDPNDIVPHEERRELRALRVFGAWTNLTDLKAGNTLDVLVTENGRGVVRHFLQDVGSTFGMGANGPHDWDEGWEYFYEGGATRKRLLTFGFGLSPWQTVPYEKFDSVGRLEGDRFDPTTWKPHTPTTGYVDMRADDAFWAARRVMAFSDELIRAAVKTGALTEAGAEQYFADALIKRRNAIGRAYLPAINPIVDPKLSASGVLTFTNAAVQYGVAEAPESYKAVWSTFDNATGATTHVGDSEGREASLQAPSGLSGTTGSFIRVDLSAVSAAHPSWAQPVVLHFRRVSDGWKLVGLERQPDGPPPAPKSRPSQEK